MAFFEGDRKHYTVDRELSGEGLRLSKTDIDLEQKSALLER
jgi:hypothetical protein